mmetsp:Transcript_12753/g.27141  ORF Transcript_12753/g.27141 Transcript_12753/m.27141 type:complete len:234 (-) Transcript_12753:58-759(-)
MRFGRRSSCRERGIFCAFFARIQRGRTFLVYHFLRQIRRHRVGARTEPGRDRAPRSSHPMRLESRGGIRLFLPGRGRRLKPVRGPAPPSVVVSVLVLVDHLPQHPPRARQLLLQDGTGKDKMKSIVASAVKIPFFHALGVGCRAQPSSGSVQRSSRGGSGGVGILVEKGEGRLLRRGRHHLLLLLRDSRRRGRHDLRIVVRRSLVRRDLLRVILRLQRMTALLRRRRRVRRCG